MSNGTASDASQRPEWTEWPLHWVFAYFAIGSGVVSYIVGVVTDSDPETAVAAPSGSSSPPT